MSPNYFQRELLEAGFPREARTVRALLEFCIQNPTARRIRVLAATLFYIREVFDVSDEVFEACLDYTAILCAERDALGQTPAD